MIAGLLGGVLVGSLLAGVPALAEPRPGPRHLSSQVESLDNVGGEARGVAWPVRQPVDVTPPAAVWPKPGTFWVTGARTADMPLWIDRAAGAVGAAAAPAPEVTAQVLDRAAVPAPWRDSVVVRLGTPESASATGPVTVALDYSAFRHAYGAGWAARLKFWLLPECALTTPGRPGCDARALPSVNRSTSQVVTADVTVAPLDSGKKSRRPLPDGEVATSGTLIALAAGASGSGGDFAATPMAPSSTWAAGGSSGGFSWSYAMRVPPDIGGPSPALSLNYSSSSVDGRSDATNNQPSWIGEGFEYSPGYIERRYVPCSEDRAGSPNNTKDSGDLCWRSDNATMSLNGSGGELVYQSGKGWHARTEDASRVEKLTGGSSGDDNGEYWKVTASDGTQYFFGLNRPAGQSTDTNSTWTVPVFGNHSGEPCHATAFMDSNCPQAWRWNLDYVIDPRGNTMSYWYEKELNQYAQYNTDTNNAAYVRGGMLKQIDYGTWDRGSNDRSVAPVAQVVFTPGDRCVSDCWTGSPPVPNKPKWPDTPWDQECKLTATSCPSKYSPTFWSTKRLSVITTKVWDTTQIPARWQDVDSWTLSHSFPPGGDGSVHTGLWLDSIVHAGHVGGTVTMPPVTFTPISLPNRVLSPTNTTNNWQRIDTIVSETGALVNVDYSLPECTSGNTPLPESNTKRCYPVIGIDPADPFGKRLLTEWWHKYVVTMVSESDVQLVGGHQAPTKFTYYEYGGTPAWHYADDDGLTKPDRKTWNQYRGYATVKVRVGDVPGQQTLTETRYLRGMHGDRLNPSGGTRTVTVSASIGTETVYDEDQFAGMVREQIVYDGVDTKPVSKTVNVPWMSPATASRTINGDTVTARFVETKTSYEATALGVDGARGWRTLRTENKFDDTYGTLDWSQDDGDMSVSGDEKCVSHIYNRNLAKNIMETVKQTTTTALACGLPPRTSDDIISDTRNTYDQAASPDTAPVYGSISKTEQLKDWTAAGGTQWQTVSESTFDAFGRTKAVKDIKGNVTTTDYTPASGGPTTATTETNPLGWVTTTQLAPHWGATVKTTDPNGRVTDVVYDPLGRVSKVWKVGWSKTDNTTSPSVEYAYVFSPTRSDYPYTQTRTLHAGGSYLTSYQIFDALLRPRQSQTAAVGGGRVVTDTIYDRLGRVEAAYNPHVEPGTESGSLWWEPEWSVPAVTKTVYDNAGRATASIFLAGDGVTNLVEKWRTTTAYEGDLTKVTPPAGGTPTTTVTDIQGRTVELRQHTTAQGVAGPYDATRYTFNGKDQQTRVADPVGNEWTYTFDVKGRLWQTRDPDKGLTVSEYNDYNELVKTTDARNEVLVFTHDQLGRKTAVYDDIVSAATLRAEWKYDRLYTGQTVRGQLTETIRYEPAGSGNAYKWQVRNFTTRYQPGGINVVIPAVEGTGLSSTWVYSYGYSPYDGSPTALTYPAAGGLAGETLTTVYDTVSGLPRALNTDLPNVSSYVIGQQYTAYREPTITTRKTAGGAYVEDANYYELDTRRLKRTSIQPETATATVSDRSYGYDDVGNITSVAEAPQVGQADTQCFRYDPLRRLATAWTPKSGATCGADPTLADLGGPAPYWLDWTFDAAGNRLTETSHATGGDTKRTYTVPVGGPGVTRPHAVTSLKTEAPGQTAVVQNYEYDNTGNTVCRPSTTATNTCPSSAASQTLTWDSEGHVATITQGTSTTTNIYDASGTRLIRRDATGTTLYLPGMELRRQGASTTATRHYTFADKTCASRTPGGLSWLFSDHQGTQQLSVDAITQQVTVRRQTPYGEPRPNGSQPTWPNQKGFVGGTNDPTGLINIGARQYDPAIGAFVSVDQLIDYSHPQQMHGYSYGDGSPVTFSDPTGLLSTCGDGPGGRCDGGGSSSGGGGGCTGTPDRCADKAGLNGPLHRPKSTGRKCTGTPDRCADRAGLNGPRYRNSTRRNCTGTPDRCADKAGLNTPKPKKPAPKNPPYTVQHVEPVKAAKPIESCGLSPHCYFNEALEASISCGLSPNCYFKEALERSSTVRLAVRAVGYAGAAVYATAITTLYSGCSTTTSWKIVRDAALIFAAPEVAVASLFSEAACGVMGWD